MGTVTAAIEAVGAFFKWLTGRQDLANDPAIKQNKRAQEEQAEADHAERLVKIAMSDPDPAKRFAAADELRKMDSE